MLRADIHIFKMFSIHSWVDLVGNPQAQGYPWRGATQYGSTSHLKDNPTSQLGAGPRSLISLTDLIKQVVTVVTRMVPVVGGGGGRRWGWWDRRVSRSGWTAIIKCPRLGCAETTQSYRSGVGPSVYTMKGQPGTVSGEGLSPSSKLAPHCSVPMGQKEAFTHFEKDNNHGQEGRPSQSWYLLLPP